jgi:tripartite-type tricarboxylate transporter receptor subunit TctC
MKAKRILCIGLILVFVFSFAACSNASQEDAENTETTAQTSTQASAEATAGTSAEATVSETVDFPTKQITIVVPYDAGGASDTMTRVFAPEFSNALGNASVIVENRSGGTGAVGLEYVKNSAADGYTLLYLEITATMIKYLGYTDVSAGVFIMLARTHVQPAAITVKADSKWNTLDDFIAYAKENPGKVTIGNAGTGSAWHVSAVYFGQKTGCEFTHVPFNGGAPAAAALMGGNVDCAVTSVSEVQSGVESGDLKILAVLGDERTAVYPDVPTAKELGYDVSFYAWGGFAVPVGTPDAVVKILAEAASKAANSDAIKTICQERGFDFAYLGMDDAQAFKESEMAKFAEVIPALDLTE